MSTRIFHTCVCSSRRPDRVEVSQARGGSAARDAQSFARLSGRLYGVRDACPLRPRCGKQRAGGGQDHSRSPGRRGRAAGANTCRSFGDRRHASRSANLSGRPALGRRASRQCGRSLARSARPIRPRVRASRNGRTARSHWLHRRPIEAASRARLLAHDCFARGRHASRRSRTAEEWAATTGANK